ncbi:hypothetical protein [Methanobacterium sp.]|jgi:hypothetical protein|uniref:hypothetical protein n=1 Tax=Methanobacterium sp. TaxID=2164 RepID=UPI003157F4F7
MVSNDEISQKLRSKREGTPLNSYLVCNKCGGYYELQPGESWKEFDTECGCGGQLVHNDTNSLVSRAYYMSEEEYEHKMYSTEILIAYIAFFLFWPISLVLGFYLLTRDNKRAKFHGKLILALSIIPIFVMGIAALLVYKAYFSQPAVNPAMDISNVRSMQLFAACFLNLKVI